MHEKSGKRPKIRQGKNDMFHKWVRVLDCRCGFVDFVNDRLNPW